MARGGTRLLAAAAAAMAATAGSVAHAAPAPGADTLTARLVRADIAYRERTALTGQAHDAAGLPAGGRGIVLEASPFPFGPFRIIAHATTAADGSFRFDNLAPDRNTRYRVSEGRTSSPVVAVTVETPAIQRLYELRYGLVMATVLSYHPPSFRWGHLNAFWFVARGASRSFHLVAVTHTREVRPGLTYVTATFLPPAGRFVYRVCFDAPGQRAFGTPRGACPHIDFLVKHAV